MSGFTPKHLPLENEQDFERLCLHLLREHWKNPDLQMYGRRGQRQNGVDILDLSGQPLCRAAQCKNFNPLEVFTVDDLQSSVEAAKSFRPQLHRLEIMTTAKKSTETQLQLLRTNLEHRKNGLFRVRLKTWDEIDLLLNKYPSVSEHVYGAGLWTAINSLTLQVRHTANRIEELSRQGESLAEPDSTELNCALLTWPGSMLEVSDRGQRIMVPDYSILPLAIEEYISVGAVELALDFVPGEFPGLLERIPALLRKRLRFVGNPSLRQNVVAILSPVYEEFGVESLGGIGLRFTDASPVGLRDSIVTVWGDLYTFLVGMKNRLQIDIDLGAFLCAVRNVRYQSKNPDSRANLAVLEGILSSYRARRIECVGLRPSASNEAVTLFNELAGIEAYRDLSRAARNIGVPDYSDVAIQSFSQISRDLVRSEEFQGLLASSSRRIAASQKMQQDDVLQIVRPSSSGFLPPIVSFEAARIRALKAYKKSELNPLLHDSIKNRLEVEIGNRKWRRLDSL
jgi:hypothetical protein